MEAIYYFDQLNKATLLSLKNKKTTAAGPANNSIHIPSLEFVQKTLDENTVLLSYHLSELEMITLLISKNSFTYYKNPINPFFYQRIDSLCKMLYNNSTVQKDHTPILASELYTYLITPVQEKLFSVKRLIIIPEGELISLPFDILIDSDKKYLVEKYAIQYLYSTSLLTGDKQSLNDQGTLIFAPFAKRSYADSSISFSRLPETGKEAENLNGILFADAAATKEKFLTLANSQGILHLATHAQLNNEDPQKSFIAFYPNPVDSVDSKLYASEIYNLRLDSTRLVILSACEAGGGRLVNNEGLTSLNRAFSYAGCPNIITSLWKANDQTTAIIISKLYYYLSRGFSADMALQKAKIDLLHNSTIDPKLKDPGYWAHLVSVGNYDPIRHGLQWRWVAIGTILLMLIYYFTKKGTAKKIPDVTKN
jgi:CHAT domain-containing protein